MNMQETEAEREREREREREKERERCTKGVRKRQNEGQEMKDTEIVHEYVAFILQL